MTEVNANIKALKSEEESAGQKRITTIQNQNIFTNIPFEVQIIDIFKSRFRWTDNLQQRNVHKIRLKV